jgi:hypothetical protein
VAEYAAVALARVGAPPRIFRFASKDHLRFSYQRSAGICAPQFMRSRLHGNAPNVFAS